MGIRYFFPCIHLSLVKLSLLMQYCPELNYHTVGIIHNKNMIFSNLLYDKL